jgi:predicted TIM-barrel fold metal-dependent hydrolase
VSEGIPFAAGAARQIFAQALAMASFRKVLYGSDGFGLPETLYVGAKLVKEALAAVLGDLVEDGLLAPGEAQAAAGLILAGNAQRLYGIARQGGAHRSKKA